MKVVLSISALLLCFALQAQTTYTLTVRTTDEPIAKGAYEPTLESLQNEYLSEQTLAPNLKAPLHLILSDNGTRPLYNEESLQKYCGAGFKVWTIPGTGHYPMVEAPDEFNRQLAQILNVIH